MKKKYGDLSHFLKEANSIKLEKSSESMNFSRLSNKQLGERIRNLEIITETTKVEKKNNRNGKIEINRHNNYIPNKYAHKKDC